VLNLILFLITVFDLSLYALPEYKVKEQIKSENKLVYNNISQLYQGKVIVFDITSAFLLSQEPFVINKTNEFKHILLHDLVHAQHSRLVRDYTKDVCNCNPYSYASFYRYISDENNNVILISTPERIEIKKHFLKNSYGIDVEFKKSTIISEKDNLFSYQVFREK
jgi:hypothetical protein